MRVPATIIVTSCLLAAWVVFDLVRTLRTGRAHSRYGTFTRISRVDFGATFILIILSWHSALQRFAGQSSGQIPSGEPQTQCRPSAAVKKSR
jgi:hypothetical protein